MNASKIISDDMTLEEKLEAINKAMAEANAVHLAKNPGSAPLDPADLTMCEGCQ